MVKMNSRFFLLACLVAIIALAATSCSQTQNLYGKALQLLVDQPEADIGTQVVVDVYVTDAVDMMGAQFDLGYDDQILSFSSIEEGEFLSEGGAVSTFFPVNSTLNTSVPGLLRGVVITRVANNGSYGEGSLVRVTFDTIGAGDSALQFVNVLLSDSEGNPISTDVIGTSVTVTDPTQDTESPSVWITNPSSSFVSGTISVTATASDNVGVAGVQFLLNGANLGNEDKTEPYEISWDTTTVPDGVYEISAVARDGAGNVAQADPVTVTVDNVPDTDSSPPTVSIVEPSDGYEVKGRWIDARALAADNTGVAGIQFYLDGGKIGAEGATADYSIRIDSKTLLPGNHILSAVARDEAGNTGSDAITIIQPADEGGGKSKLPPGKNK